MRMIPVVRAARAVLGAALDLVYPSRCYACDRDLSRGRLCDRCRGELVPILNPCPRCAAPRGPGVSGKRCDSCRSTSPGFRAAVAAVEYEGPAPTLVQRFKYSGERYQAYLLGEMLSGAVLDAPFVSEIEALVPVPLDPIRRRERGFNQAGLLADEVARAIEVPVRERWLSRRRATLPQAGLSRRARQRNLEGCFRADARRVEGRGVLIVDDVMTTGSTLAEAARTLRRAGAKRVYAAAFARA